MDAWVVEVLREGYRIPFSRRPPLSDQPLPMPAYTPSSIRGKALEQEFQDLLRKQAIEQAPQTPGFYSRLFVVQKDSGAWRPIIDLSTLNTYIASQRFHMETPQSVLRSIRPGDWMISLDLQDAYLQVLIHPESRRYLRFTMGGVSYQFRLQGTVLWADNCPSGLYTADGSNIRHSPSLRYQDAQISRRLVDSSRIQDRLSPGEGQAPSSVRGAGTTSQFQEIVLDSISGHDFSRHADPVSSVRGKTDRDKGRKSPQDHRGVSFIPGPLSSSLASSFGPPFVPYSSGKGWDVKDAVSPDSPQVQVGLPRRIASHPWDPLCQEDLLWWSWAIQKRKGVDLSLPVPDLSLYSDASDVGWGAIVGEHQVSGVWTPSQRELSINLREMMAVQKGLLEFSSLLRGKTIALFCDYVTTVAYLRRLGGTRSQVLFLKAREILLWVESMEITLLPQFIQGSLNTRADLLSQPNLVIGSEWTLHQEVVQDLLHQWPAIIDLFTTSLTARLPVFFAPAWEPKAAGVDAFLQPWDNLQAYAFPPIAIIKREPLATAI